MQKELKLVLAALCLPLFAFAQGYETDSLSQPSATDDSGFTLTESQLGEDDNATQNVTIISSNTDVFAAQSGFTFSTMRFRYRAYNQKYNEVFINGAPVNDFESGQFRYTNVGGLNQLTRNSDFALPFENCTFAMQGVAGSVNYNFRPGAMPVGHRLNLSVSNRNYILRGAYGFGSGFNNRGWAFAGTLMYRWGQDGNTEGVFYNSLSYYLGVQKRWDSGHSLSLMTWGNPTERSSQGAATDESYWLANDYHYNPYWGYQNGHKRNSRIINDFAPAVMLTWDWNINDYMKLTTALQGKMSWYKSSKLDYNNSDNPQPDYWKNMPSSYYDVWDETDVANRTQQDLEDWQTAVDYLTASKANRQINWDRLYAANKNLPEGADAMYYLRAKHNDNSMLSFSSILNVITKKNSKWNLGMTLGRNRGRHYETIEDLLGAKTFHNLNSYAIGTYAETDDKVQYDLNCPNREVKEGDTFGYDYELRVNKGRFWTNLSTNTGLFNFMFAAKAGASTIGRRGNMRNGMFPQNSYGESGTAIFGEGGGKANMTMNISGGQVFSVGVGLEWRAPEANTAFVSPEMNNDFVTNLRDEQIFSSNLSYQLKAGRLQANVNAYYSRIQDATEWQNFYFDDINSFSYVSMTNISKAYYGLELGLRYSINNNLKVLLLGTIGDAKYLNNADVVYMSSTTGTFNDNNDHKPEKVLNKNMRESGTPLTLGCIEVSYSNKGWWLTLQGKYYDRIYLGYSPNYRYESTIKNRAAAGDIVYDNDGNVLESALAQAKGKGGFMLDGSISKNLRLRRGKSLNLGLMLSNILNNEKMVSGGYEQSRSDYTASGNTRAYKFSLNPKKYYVYGINGMFNVIYKF